MAVETQRSVVAYPQSRSQEAPTVHFTQFTYDASNLPSFSRFF